MRVGRVGCRRARCRRRGDDRAARCRCCCCCCLLFLAPLGASVLEPDLDARLAQLEAERELFAREHVRILGLGELELELIQLIGGEGGARAAYLAADRSTIGIRLVHVEFVVLGVVGRLGRVVRVAAFVSDARFGQRWRARMALLLMMKMLFMLLVVVVLLLLLLRMMSICIENAVLQLMLLLLLLML